ncbi:MAG TPA: SHOCT domain-containing protein [Acidimicrobiales bacterium]|nr:SHOCT domain-containing protein [Acidimicrobiales bacterium]
MGIFDSSEQARTRRRDRSSAASGPDEQQQARWRAEGKFYEYTGFSDEGVGHPLTITVYADRITTTPGHEGAAANGGVTRLPVRGVRVEEVPLRAVDGVDVEKATVTQVRIRVNASLQSLAFLCRRTMAEQVRHDLEAGISEAMIAAARRAVPEAPIPAIANLIAADDPAARIEQLAGLRDRDLITEQEFEAKKRQILGL